MIGTPRRRGLVLAGAGLVIAGLAVWERMSRANDPTVVATALRDQLRDTRAQAEACLDTRDRISLRFDALAERSDSLRAEVDRLEALDPRGVPGDRYAEYLALVDEFNASVPEWERESRDLVGHVERCRDLVALHNAQLDSLERHLVDAGIWAEEWLGPGWSEPVGNEPASEAAPGAPK
jgi:hypothetical protein